MTSPRTYRALGLTLRRSPVREADLLSVIYTREHGKLELLARGAQRLTSKLMGHLEPLTLVRVSVARGRSMDHVTEAEVVEAFPAVKNGYQNSARGLYVAELIDGFSALSVANAELFSLAVQTLYALGAARDPDLALRYFDLQLLGLSGFLPELYNCVECGEDLGTRPAPFCRRRWRNPVHAMRPFRRDRAPAVVAGAETAAAAPSYRFGWSLARIGGPAAAGTRSAGDAERNHPVLAGPQGPFSGIFGNCKICVKVVSPGVDPSTINGVKTVTTGGVKYHPSELGA